MADTAQNIDDRDEETEDDEAASSNDNGETEQMNAKLEKLYDQLPKLLAHIVKDNTERHNALDALLRSFNVINDLENKLAGENEKPEPLNLSRIYELASSGGDSTDLEELRQANAAFAEENGILAETIESLTFQLSRLRGEKIDDQIEDEKLKPVSFDDVKKSADEIRSVLGAIEKKFWFLNTDNGNSPDKPIDERFLEDISRFDDITADLLKAAPRNTTFLGRILRRAGLAYDYKDIEAARQLVVSVLKANREMANFIAAIEPARNQLDKMHEIANLLELASGHQERQSSQYREALQEIDRLDVRLGRYKQACDDLESLETKVKQKRQSTRKKIEELQAEIDEIQKELEKAEEGSIENMEAKIADFEEQIAKLNRSLERQKEQNKALKNTARDIKNFSQKKEGELSDEISSLKSKLRVMKDGLLVEKLEMEILTLRDMAEKSEKTAEEEREKRKAFEERVNIWIRDSEKLQLTIEKWRKRALIKGSKIAIGVTAVGAVAAYGGYMSQGLVANHANPLVVWGMGMLTPAFFAALGRIAYERLEHQENWANSFREGRSTALRWGVMGAIATGFAYIPMTMDYDNAKDALIQAEARIDNEYRKHLLASCGNSPCQIIQGEDGKISVIKLAEKYAGESVIFTFAKSANGSAESQRLILGQPVNVQDTQPDMSSGPN